MATTTAGCALFFALMGVQREARSGDIIFFTGDSFGAIAYSEKTGKYGYACNKPSRDIAETLARRYCKAQDPKADDAKVVVWVHNGFCAPAVGDRGAWGIGWSNGNGASNTAAKERALKECARRGKNGRLLLCVCSVKKTAEILDRK
jgi:serine/threonine-protein kinase